MWGQILGVGAALLGGSVLQSKSAEKASRQQAQAADAGIAEQARQFDELRRLLEPYVAAGQPALQGQQALIGLRGASEQESAISQIEQSPLLQSLTRQGEQAMLQRASATGGLRGGNIQAALAQFRPMMLQEAIDKQYARLGGLTSLGQQSAAGVGSAGMETGQAIAGLQAQRGAALAGGTLGQAAPFVQALGMPAAIAGFGLASGRWNPFGASSPARPSSPAQPPGLRAAAPLD
ncbi:MAG: hypothetical protein ACK5XV_03865 [Flavobacteriales bacterium]|jgi:hypothetical protein